MAAPMQLGRQAQAAQGRAVKQTRANYVGAAGNELAPAAPAAVKPQAIAPVGPVPQPVSRQQAPQVRDRRFAQNQAAYQQSAPPAPGMMPLAYIPKPTVNTGRVGNLPVNTKGAMQGAGGNQAAWGGQQVSMAPQTLSALLGKNGSPGVQGTGGNQAAWGGQQVAANAQSMPVPPPTTSDATGTVKTGTMYGKHESAPQQDQHMAGVAQQNILDDIKNGAQSTWDTVTGGGQQGNKYGPQDGAVAGAEGGVAVQNERQTDPVKKFWDATAGNLPKMDPWWQPGLDPETVPDQARTAGYNTGSTIGGIVSGIGDGLTPTTDAINTADEAMRKKFYGDVDAGLADQDAKANAQYGSPARAAAEQAAKDEMNLGINTQRDSQLRQLLGMQGRGGAVSQGQGNAINNSATMAQQAGERGLTQDSYERNRQATQDLLAQLQGTNDRRKGMHDDIFTSNKDTLSLILGAVNPLSRVIPT